MTYAENAAMELRRRWMKARGMDHAEIEEACDPQRYPANLKEEIENIKAQERLDHMDRSHVEAILQYHFPLVGPEIDLSNL